MKKRIIEIKPKRSAPTTPMHALGETDYSDFLPIKKIIDPLRLNNGNRTEEKIKKENDYDLIAEFLAHIGFRRSSNIIKDSERALVFESNNHQIIRIVGKEFITDANRLSEPLVLQPLIRANISDKYVLEILPEVHTLEEVLKDEHLMTFYGIPKDSRSNFNWKSDAKDILRVNLQKCNCFMSPYDSKDANIAVMRDAGGKTVLLILDPGAVYLNDQKLSKHAPAIRAYYEAVQQAHLKSLGLERGKLKSVLDDDALSDALQEFACKREHHGYSKVVNYPLLEKVLAAFLGPTASKDLIEKRKHSRSSKAVYHRVLDAGVSLGEFGTAAKNAKRSDKGFCHDIREELKEHHNNPLQSR